jgi:ATP-dependent DNA helicase RecG
LAQRAELDAGQIRAFRQLLATQNPANPVLGYDDDDLLRAYGAITQARDGAGWSPTVAGVLELGLTPPAFDSDPQDRSFRVTFYRHHFMNQDDLAWLEQFRPLALSTEEQKALVYAAKTGRVDNAAYRSLNRVDTLAASRSLTRLENLGLLQRSEQRRGPGVYYTVAAGYEGPTPQVTAQVSPQVTAQSVAELLPKVVAGERLASDQMDTLIVALCAERPRRARELGEILQRSARHLRDVYLSRLVDEGRLELTGSPNDPTVAYRARVDVL